MRSQLLVETAELDTFRHDPAIVLLDATATIQSTPDGLEWRDCRNIYESGHIPGATYFDLLGDFSDRTSPFPAMLQNEEVFNTALGGLGVNNNSKVVIYSTTHVMWATRAWWMLRIHGCDAVVLNGGFKKWKDEGRPVSKGTEGYPPATFYGKRKAESVASLAEVEGAVNGGDCTLINGLTEASFNGTGGHPYGGRRGHIPKSQNLPFDSLLNPTTGCFHSTEEIRMLVGKLDMDDNEKVITYCGGGIAATMATFALALAGFDNVAVYDASLSEWARDPSLPMNLTN